MFFDSNLQGKLGKPILKEKSVVRVVVLKENMIYVISGELEIDMKSHLPLDKIITWAL